MDIQYFRENGSWDAIDEQYFYRHLSLTIPYMTLLCVASVMGTIGNFLVIVTVLATKKLRTVANMFIVNLAIADMCVSSFVDIFSTISIKKGEVYFDDKWALCEIVASVCLTSCYCSLLSMAGISFNRFIHICYHHLYEKLFTFKKGLFIILSLWVISFVMEMPSFFGWGDHVYDRKTLSCIWDRTHSFSYTLFFALGGVGIPWTMTIVCYAKIFRHVRYVRGKVCGTKRLRAGDIRQTKERNESMKLARTLFIIFVVFTICWTPYAVIVVSDVDDVYPTAVHSYSVLVAHTNSSINSILYGVTHSRFRKAYYNIFMRILHFFKCPFENIRSSPNGFVSQRASKSHDLLTIHSHELHTYKICSDNPHS